jgi:hypothetical protein
MRRMKIATLLVFLAVTAAGVASAPLMAADKARDWKPAKVLDSEKNESSKKTTLIIQGDDYEYTIQDTSTHSVVAPPVAAVAIALANRGHGCRFIVNEDVKYAQEPKDKTHLFILDADGKQCKVDILRQEKRPTQAEREDHK